jgi:hypothetical protein
MSSRLLYSNTMSKTLLRGFAALVGACVVISSVRADDWDTAKKAQIPKNELTNEFQTPFQQSLANLAWEDGLYISRDGLTLYSIYASFDVLSALLNGESPDQLYLYQRGNLIGQDFSNPLPGVTTPWFHADIAISQRSSLSDPFSSWSLSNLKTRYSNRGAPQGVSNPSNPNVFDYFIYTDNSKFYPSNSSNQFPPKLYLIKNTPTNPSNPGTLLPDNINESAYNQDNGHLERSDPAQPGHLVLFYESDNKPTSQPGKTHIWYSTTSDGGNTWSNPISVSSINSGREEQQPHLYWDGSQYWLYFAATNPSDSKLAIYRSKQSTKGDWDSWQTRQLVVSAGSSLGVGEPTLTSNGDLSFVVVTQNPNGTNRDKFDADPWFMKAIAKGFAPKISRTGAGFKIDWPSQNGKIYQIEYSSNLVNWTSVTNITATTNSSAWIDNGSVTDALNSSTKKIFYRLKY